MQTGEDVPLPQRGVIRLVGDGTPRGTRLEVGGFMVPRVQSITLTLDARDGTNEATVVLRGVSVELDLDEDAVTVLQAAIAGGRHAAERETGISG